MPDHRVRQSSAEEQAARARALKYMGILSSVLVMAAVGVAFVPLARAGVSPWEALTIGASALPWVLLILGLGVLFSIGTARITAMLERLVSLRRRKKSGN